MLWGSVKGRALRFLVGKVWAIWGERGEASEHGLTRDAWEAEGQACEELRVTASGAGGRAGGWGVLIFSTVSCLMASLWEGPWVRILTPRLSIYWGDLHTQVHTKPPCHKDNLPCSQGNLKAWNGGSIGSMQMSSEGLGNPVGAGAW